MPLFSPLHRPPGSRRPHRTFVTLSNIYLHLSYDNSLMHRAPGTTRSLASGPGPGRANWTERNRTLWNRAERSRLGRSQARPGNVNVRTNLCPMSFKGAVAVKATAVRSHRPVRESLLRHRPSSFELVSVIRKRSYQSFRRNYTRESGSQRLG